MKRGKREERKREKMEALISMAAEQVRMAKK